MLEMTWQVFDVVICERTGQHTMDVVYVAADTPESGRLTALATWPNIIAINHRRTDYENVVSPD